MSALPAELILVSNLKSTVPAIHCRLLFERDTIRAKAKFPKFAMVV
jgi:hypothetical protein